MISKQIEELLYINAENPEIKYVSNDFSIDWHVISNLLSATGMYKKLMFIDNLFSLCYFTK